MSVLGQVPTYDDICNHLAYYGAPLIFDKAKNVVMGLEEATKWGLRLSKTDGLLESVMPYFLLLNFRNLNRAKLLSLLDQEDQFQLLGYFLELASLYSKNKEIKKFLVSFYRKGFPPFHFGIERPSVRALKVLKAKKNSAAKTWNVLSLGSTEDYFERFRKWDRVG